jgi:coenzyme F420-0:L-glutamate ligase/coenzyme F420-1:gamma-L-glutamate ligase
VPIEVTMSVLALSGIPEIRIHDDLGTIIGDAIERTSGARPLTDADVLVVTQKVVSKAEGAVIDLTGVVPGEEALAFARRYDRDPRQVQVVLDAARRVVRMENGVLITETAHGFVCANGGVDASNVGPDSGSIVTLLPRDPDASAASIRAAIRGRFGIDVPVIVSDSFGRPWRWGIVDVAIGVSGLLPLTTCAARPTPTAGSCVHRSGRGGRAGVSRGAHAREERQAAGRACAGGIHPWRGFHPRRHHPQRERPVPLSEGQPEAAGGQPTARPPHADRGGQPGPSARYADRGHIGRSDRHIGRSATAGARPAKP